MNELTGDGKFPMNASSDRNGGNSHQIGVAYLENRLGTTQVAQAVLTQVDQSDTRRQRVPHQRSRRGRAQDLSAMARVMIRAARFNARPK